ncbi:MAG: hypothetical protein N2485_02450 [bacterium]|nr:hypothetical protein [bacterium]
MIKKLLLISVGFILSVFMAFIISCNGGGGSGIGTIPPIGGGGSGINILGKVSNTFGTLLGRDIDSDGDSDAAAVFNDIAGGNGDDIGNSLYVDSSGKVYVTGDSYDGSNKDMYVLQIE